MSSFHRRALEAWRTRGVVTYGPRLSDDPRYAAMRAGQLTHPDAHEFGMFGPVTCYTAASALLISPPTPVTPHECERGHLPLEAAIGG